MKFHHKPVQRVEYILSQCEGKKVLHLGCTNWPYTDESLKNGSLLHARIAEKSAALFGLDADSSGLDRLRANGFENVYAGDLERLDECGLDQKFDVVVAGEMIEHLDSPGLFLHGVKRFLENDSKLIITTINAYGALRFLIYGLRGKGGQNEPVHPDHVAYYSYSTLRLLLERNGFRISEFLFYDLGTEHRPYNRAVWNLANDATVRIFPQLSDGIIAVCSVFDLSSETAPDVRDRTL